MNLHNLTLNEILSGTLVLASANIKALITTEDNSPVKNYISDFTTIDHISEPFDTAIKSDTVGFGYSNGVYLSANSCIFTNITADYSSTPAYVYTFADTGDPETSIILADQYMGYPSIIGETTFKINDNKIILFRDYDQDQTLFRLFRADLLAGNIGNIGSVNIGCAVLSSSYTPNLTSTSYTQISSFIISEALVPDVYIDQARVKTNTSYIQFPNTTGRISSVVFYISSVTPQDISLIGYYNTGALQPNILSATGNEVYLKLSQNTIFGLNN